MSLGPLKAEAERRAAEGSSLYPSRCSRAAASVSERLDLDGVSGKTTIVGVGRRVTEAATVADRQGRESRHATGRDTRSSPVSRRTNRACHAAR